VQLLELIMESLERFNEDLHGEWRSVGNLWNYTKQDGNTPKSEDHLSNEVARHLKHDLADRAIVIGRELRLQIPIPGASEGLRTDIDVQAPRITGPGEGERTPRVIVEVKGSWNKDLKTAMGEQLVEKYLEPHRVTAGLFLVGYFTCASWTESAPKQQSQRCGSLADLRQVLSAQAAELTNAMREVRVQVLNTSLPTSASEGSRIQETPGRKRGLTATKKSKTKTLGRTISKKGERRSRGARKRDAR
jgi:hypothetical protein